MQNPEPLAVTSLVLGICSIVLGWFPIVNFFALAAGIVGLVLSIMASKRAAAQNLTAWDGKGMNTAGLVLSIIGIAICVIYILLWVFVFSVVTTAVHDVNWYLK